MEWQCWSSGKHCCAADVALPLMLQSGLALPIWAAHPGSSRFHLMRAGMRGVSNYPPTAATHICLCLGAGFTAA